MAMRVTGAVVGLVAAGVWGVADVAIADTIRLKNGSTIEVEGWRDLGDVVEFAFGGGIVRIRRGEIEKIDGRATEGDLPMYSAPATPAAAADRATLVKQMADLLKQGEGLVAQTVLTAAEKAAAFRRLGEAWKGLQVPDALRDAHARAQQALQMLAEAYTAEGEGTAPDAKERVEKAKGEMQAAQDEVKKAGEAG